MTLLVFSQQADPEDAVTSEPGIPNTPERVLLKASKREWLELRWTSLFQTTHAVRLKKKIPFSLISYHICSKKVQFNLSELDGNNDHGFIHFGYCWLGIIMLLLLYYLHLLFV